MPDGMVGEGDARRFSIYRTAYRARLREVLRSDHPATARGLGAAYTDVVDAFVVQRPSGAWSLRHAGTDFPGFVAEVAPRDAAAWAELAAFERLLLDVFDAPTAHRLTTLRRPDSVLESVVFHPSVRRLGTRFNTVEHWHAQRRGDAVPSWLRHPAQWVLWRSREQRTSFRAIDASEAALIDCLVAGASFPDSLEALAERVDVEAIPGIAMACLERWTADGMLCAVNGH